MGSLGAPPAIVAPRPESTSVQPAPKPETTEPAPTEPAPKSKVNTEQCMTHTGYLANGKLTKRYKKKSSTQFGTDGCSAQEQADLKQDPFWREQLLMEAAVAKARRDAGEARPAGAVPQATYETKAMPKPARKKKAENT